jgi:outer membrane protein TolC
MTAYKTAEARYNQAVAQLNQAKLTEQSVIECRHRAIAGSS